jgi:hypothetical protein
MLRKITQAAYLNPAWRPTLVPLVQLGALQRVRVASGTIPLRTAIIRTAFTLEDAALRSVLVKIVAAHDRGEPDQWSANSAAQLVRLGRQTSNPDLRRRVASLLRSAKYSPGFLRWVERHPPFRNPDTGNEVGFHSLPPKEQKKVHEQWQAGKKDWAQQHKPEGLGKETVLTPEKFDEAKEGDLLWVSFNPKKLYKVLGRSKSPHGKSMLDCVLVDRDDPSQEGEKRVLHRSTVENDKHEIHILPAGGGEPAEPAKGEEPKHDEAPPKAEAPKGKPPKEKRPLEESEHDEAPQTDESAEHEEAPEKAKDEKPEEAPEKAKAPGKHKDRKQLRGRGKKKETDSAHVTPELRAMLMPSGLVAEQKEHAERQLENADYRMLQLVLDNAELALQDPAGKFMKRLKKQGHTPEGVAKLHKALQKKLADVKGRLYSKSVLDVANKYDLEGEDADELYAFKHDRPHWGRKLPPEQLKQKFLLKASPETRERMKGMDIGDFMAMYNAIMADEEEGDAAKPAA